MTGGGLDAFVKSKTVENDDNASETTSGLQKDKRVQSPANSRRQAAAQQARVNLPRTVLGDYKLGHKELKPPARDEKASVDHEKRLESTTHIRDMSHSTQHRERDMFDTDVDSIGDSTTMSMGQSVWPAEAEEATSHVDSSTNFREAKVSKLQKDVEHEGQVPKYQYPSVNKVMEENGNDDDGEESNEEVEGPPSNDDTYGSSRFMEDFLGPGEVQEYQRFVRERDPDSTRGDLDNLPRMAYSVKATDPKNGLQRTQNSTQIPTTNKNQYRGPSRTPEEFEEQISTSEPLKFLPSFQNATNLWTSTSTQSRRGLLKHSLSEQLQNSSSAREKPSSGKLSNLQNTVVSHKTRRPQGVESPSIGTFDGSDISSRLLNDTSNGRDDFSTDSNNVTSSEQGLKRSAELDYSRDQLSQMSFSQLEKQSFDQDPSASIDTLPTKLKTCSLAEKLQYLCNSSDTSPPDLKQHLETQRHFFSSLTIEQYEECGDLLVDQFSDILKRFREVRRDKRKVAVEFEAEVSRREAAVTERKGLLEKDMGRLRKAGQDVVRGG